MIYRVIPRVLAYIRKLGVDFQFDKQRFHRKNLHMDQWMAACLMIENITIIICTTMARARINTFISSLQAPHWIYDFSHQFGEMVKGFVAAKRSFQTLGSF